MTDHTILPASTSTHAHTIIFLHGRSSTATEFAGELFESQAYNELTLPRLLPNFKWVFPTSKMRRTSRFEEVHSSWFDLWSLEDTQERSELQIDGLKESIAQIVQVIQREAEVLGGPQYYDRIFLAGISQGCATAIHALFQFGFRLGGFVGLCSWLPFQKEVEECKNLGGSPIQRIVALQQTVPCLTEACTVIFQTGDTALDTPAFLSYSADDDVVPMRHGEMLCRGLKAIGMDVEWKEYPDGGHWVNEPAGIDDIVGFIRRHETRDAALQAGM